MAGVIELGNDPECLLKEFPEAYKALPECYKNDHSLKFFIDVNKNLCAEYTLHNEEYVFWYDQNALNGDWMVL
jgi:hypothetical protein